MKPLLKRGEISMEKRFLFVLKRVSNVSLALLLLSFFLLLFFNQYQPTAHLLLFSLSFFFSSLLISEGLLAYVTREFFVPAGDTLLGKPAAALGIALLILGSLVFLLFLLGVVVSLI